MDEQLFEGTVTHLSNQGYGVVKGPERRTYFVRGVWRGDQAVFRATDEQDKGYHFAELLTMLEPAAERRPSPCPHLGLGADQCFGCPWMTVDYAAQLREKQHRVVYALERLGLRDVPIQAIWPSPELYQYRRRAQFKTDGRVLGYAGRQGLCIAPIERCLVLSPRLQQQLDRLQAQLPQEDWQAHDGHIWNYLDVDEDSNVERPVLNRRRPFQQANAAQNQAMRSWLRQALDSGSRSVPVLELFAGSGNFTEVLVDLGYRNLYAVEVDAQAVERLKTSIWPLARRMDLYGKHAVQELSEWASDTQILLANPPRTGLGQLWRLARQLPRLSKVLLVSCDPQSFATDVHRLVQQGFHLRTVQPLDQMPHTPHVEIIACLER